MNKNGDRGKTQQQTLNRKVKTETTTKNVKPQKYREKQQLQKYQRGNDKTNNRTNDNDDDDDDNNTKSSGRATANTAATATITTIKTTVILHSGDISALDRELSTETSLGNRHALSNRESIGSRYHNAESNLCSGGADSDDGMATFTTLHYTTLMRTM